MDKAAPTSVPLTVSVVPIFTDFATATPPFTVTAADDVENKASVVVSITKPDEDKLGEKLICFIVQQKKRCTFI